MGSARRRRRVRRERARAAPLPRSPRPDARGPRWTSPPPSRPRCGAPSRWRRPPGVPARTQPARRLRPARRRRRRRSPRATTAARAPRTPRPPPWPQAGERARGATAVVTLEPCNHTGRTGPCAQALIAAGVRRVVFAQADPNPVAAGGARHPARRRRRGRVAGLLADEARDAQPGLDLRGRARPPVRHLEVRHHPRRPQRRRRRHQPLGLLAGRPARHPPAARAVRHDAGRHQHGRGRRPAADRPRRGRPAARRASRCAR